VSILAFGVNLPGFVLYAIGGVFGVALVIHTMHDPEWLLAIAIIYLPLNMMFVVPVAPGLNGTNAVLLLLLFAWFRQGPTTTSLPTPGRTLVRAYAVVTLLSVITAAVTLGLDFVSDRALQIKGWLDQFVVFFVFLRLVRDGKMARRMVVYMMLAVLVVVIIGFQEWLEKHTASSMEKARLLGPQMQPNDFGAFLATGSVLFLTQLIVNIRRLRVWVAIAPILAAIGRLLVASFSRGAYLGMALGIVAAGYVRGKLFLIGAAILGLALVFAAPQFVPGSLQARMSQTSAKSAGGDQLDGSSQTRLILWDAAVKMTLESPVFGWGFRSFPVLKDKFTERPVEESDNHNMFLYVASQMGVPALLLLLLILWRMYSLGAAVYRGSLDGPARAAGMAAASMSAATVMINMFGSRMVDICVTVHFWVMLAVVARLWMEMEERKRAENTSLPTA
jgi:O-antigen ligase